MAGESLNFSYDYKVRCGRHGTHLFNWYPLHSSIILKRQWHDGVIPILSIVLPSCLRRSCRSTMQQFRFFVQIVNGSNWCDIRMIQSISRNLLRESIRRTRWMASRFSFVILWTEDEQTYNTSWYINTSAGTVLGWHRTMDIKERNENTLRVWIDVIEVSLADPIHMFECYTMLDLMRRSPMDLVPKTWGPKNTPIVILNLFTIFRFIVSVSTNGLVGLTKCAFKRRKNLVESRQFSVKSTHPWLTYVDYSCLSCKIRIGFISSNKEFPYGIAGGQLKRSASCPWHPYWNFDFVFDSFENGCV